MGYMNDNDITIEELGVLMVEAMKANTELAKYSDELNQRVETLEETVVQLCALVDELSGEGVDEASSCGTEDVVDDDDCEIYLVSFDEFILS